MKFGTAEGTASALPNFTLLGDIWGFPAQNTRKFAKKFPKCKYFRTTGANPSPDFSEIYVLYARHQCTQCIKIWCNLVHTLQICRHKTAMGHFSPKFLKPPSSEMTGRTQKVKVGPKMVRTCSIHMPSMVAIFRRTVSREEKWVFFCLFVFLFVALMVCVSLDYRHAHCEGYIVAIYRSILMQFSAFLEEEMPC